MPTTRHYRTLADEAPASSEMTDHALDSSDSSTADSGASLDELATALKSPGVLRSDAYLTVQTRQAQRLIEGRRADDGTPGIIGLTRFAALLRPVWNGARADDPFADWWLIRVDDAIEESERELLGLKEHVGKVLKRKTGITVSLAQSVEPLYVPLAFSNPYSFRGAYLLALYDEVVRGIFTARHVSLLDRDVSEALLADAGRHVRRAYLAALGYRFLGINRQDLKLMTARAQEAERLMGTVPPDIVDGRLKAAHAPEALTPRRFVLRNVTEPEAKEAGATAAVVTEQQEPPGDGAVSTASA